MQFLILSIGALVFVFYTFEKPPLIFHRVELEKLARSDSYSGLAARYDAAFQARKSAAFAYAAVPDDASLAAYKASNKQFDAVRKDAISAVEAGSGAAFNDTNYIFLSFVMKYLPAGAVGLILAAIFAAAMSTISAEINSLATVSIIDIYQRRFQPKASDYHLLAASRLATVFWGSYAVITARYGRSLGSLIEAVNMLGSLFYGGLLGVFVLAFAFPRVHGNAAFAAVLIGEAAIFAAHFCTSISFLWYNVIGCVVVVAGGLLLSARGVSQPHRG
jgi:Na+(H+)/acetate symporter ActP